MEHRNENEKKCKTEKIKYELCTDGRGGMAEQTSERIRTIETVSGQEGGQTKERTERFKGWTKRNKRNSFQT